MQSARKSNMALGSVVAVCSLFASLNAEACSCAGYPKDLEAAVTMAYAHSDVIFLGGATSIRRIRLGTLPQREAEFQVRAQWKGATPVTTVVWTNDGEIACGYDFRKRESYLVFAHWDPNRDRLTTSFCDLTRTEARARDAIVILNRLKKRESSIAWHEFGESGPVGREFALFHDLWAIHVPGGKQLKFNEDGTVDCPQNAQYHGANWTMKEGVLRIAVDPFTYNSTRDCWFSPISEEYPDTGACIVPEGSSPKSRMRDMHDEN